MSEQNLVHIQVRNSNMDIQTANLTATSLPTELDKNTYTHVYDRCLHHDHNIELSNFCTHIDWCSLNVQ